MSAAKFTVILTGQGGELDRETREVTASTSEFLEDKVEEAIGEIVSNWRLSIGDTIRIVEAA